MRKSQRVNFDNEKGIKLSGIVDLPDPSRHPDPAFFLYAHCFTCTKDLKATVKICRRLNEQGFAILRFDFTGLGGSGGKFSDTTFLDNCTDTLAAAAFLNKDYSGPRFLMGHSLGGAALVSVANQIDSVLGIATLASPSNTHHLASFLSRTNPDIEATGSGNVTIGGREYVMTQKMLDVLRQTEIKTVLEQQKIPHIIFHSPTDDTLAIEHAMDMLKWAAGSSTFVNLDNADHLLVDRPQDCAYVADVTALWANRILEIKKTHG